MRHLLLSALIFSLVFLLPLGAAQAEYIDAPPVVVVPPGFLTPTPSAPYVPYASGGEIPVPSDDDSGLCDGGEGVAGKLCGAGLILAALATVAGIGIGIYCLVDDDCFGGGGGGGSNGGGGGGGQPIPEPTGAVLFGAALLMAGVVRRRKNL